MKWVRLVASTIIFACGAGAAVAEEEAKDSIECWKGSYLTGFTGHAGYVIERMSIVCARWNPEKRRLDKPVYTTPGLIGRSGGGDPIDVQCSSGWAVAGGYSYDYARHDGGEVLHHFDFNCRPVGGDGDLQKHTFGSNSDAEIVLRPASRRQCADGELATGIWARYGDFIHEWHLICMRAPSLIVLTKPPGPDAFRDTMTSGRRGGGLIGSGEPPPTAPPPSTPPTPTPKMAKTTAAVDVLKAPDGEKYGGDDDFLAGGVEAPVLIDQPGWCKLKLDNFPFVVGGEGWVSATYLENCGK